MDEFDRYRAAMNEKLIGSDHLGIKRFFALDTQAYEDGALDKRTKELMGLVASTVLRCDDCITYHIKQCVQIGITRAEFLDAFNVALVVGGSITIPHLRRAIDRVDQLLEGRNPDSGRSRRNINTKSRRQLTSYLFYEDRKTAILRFTTPLFTYICVDCVIRSVCLAIVGIFKGRLSHVSSRSCTRTRSRNHRPPRLVEHR
jgi:AhpD family alkylhydroperoxidase